jgi:hypothetical protein
MEVDPSWDCPGLETSVRVEGELHITPPSARAEEWRRRGQGEMGTRGDAEDTHPSPQTLWQVEMRIPFAAFPEVNPPKAGDMWRANFYRIDRSDSPEFTSWSPTLETPPNFHVPERFGYLLFE